MNDFFQVAIDEVLNHEGSEFTDNPDDNGGPTKFGITQKDIEFYGLPSGVDDIKSLTKEAAEEIYRKHFWQTMSMDRANSALVATVILDQAVLVGIWVAVRKIQNMIGVPADGALGEKSWNEISKYDDRVFCFNFLRQMSEYYVKVSYQRRNVVFLEGWESRVFDLLQLVLFDSAAKIKSTARRLKP